MNPKRLLLPTTPWNIVFVLAAWVLIYLYVDEFFIVLIGAFLLVGIVGLVRSLLRRAGRAHWLQSGIYEDIHVATYAVLAGLVSFRFTVAVLPEDQSMYLTAALAALGAVFGLVLAADHLHYAFIEEPRHFSKTITHALVWALIVALIAVVATGAALKFGADRAYSGYEEVVSRDAPRVVQGAEPALQDAQEGAVLAYKRMDPTFGSVERCGWVCTTDHFTTAVVGATQLEIYKAQPDKLEHSSSINTSVLAERVTALVQAHGGIPAGRNSVRSGPGGGLIGLWECGNGVSLEEDLLLVVCKQGAIEEFYRDTRRTLDEAACGRLRAVAERLWEGRDVEESVQSRQYRYRGIAAYFRRCVEAPDLIDAARRR